MDEQPGKARTRRIESKKKRISRNNKKNTNKKNRRQKRIRTRKTQTYLGGAEKEKEKD